MSSSFKLLSIGNPLLDIQVRDGEKLLDKYKLKSDDAILAGDNEAGIYEEVLKDYKPVFVAGGAAQNAARAAAYVLPPKSVVYVGCVGDDELADQLRKANVKEDVESAYLVKRGEKTGACAVVITGHHRSLVTTLRASEMFDPAYLSSPEIAPLIEKATHFYIEGYFLTHGLESALIVARKAADAGKTVALNLSAPFLLQFFKVQVDQLLPFADVVIGNESEAAAWSKGNGGDENEELSKIASAIANLPKTNAARERTVIITNGANATVVASTSLSPNPRTFPVHKLSEAEIVDTNGAGDAFAGGFVGALSLGKSVEEAVEVGHRMGAMCVGQVGPTFKWPKVDVFA